MKLPGTSSLCLLLLAGAASIAAAQEIQWENLGRQHDAQVAWASNLQEKTAGTVMTMLQLKRDKPDKAPNNARFDNTRVGVEISCQHKTYALLGQQYYMGNRQVLSQEIDDSSFEPYEGTYIEAVALKVCPS